MVFTFKRDKEGKKSFFTKQKTVNKEEDAISDRIIYRISPPNLSDRQGP